MTITQGQGPRPSHRKQGRLNLCKSPFHQGGSVKAFFQNQVLVIMIIMIMMMIIIKIIMTSMTVMIMVIRSNNKNTKCPIDAHFANTSTEENSTLRLKNSSILAFPNSDYFGAKCNFTILSKYIGQFGQIISLEKDILQFLDKYIFCWTNNFWRKTFFCNFGQIHWDKYIGTNIF